LGLRLINGPRRSYQSTSRVGCQERERERERERVEGTERGTGRRPTQAPTHYHLRKRDGMFCRREKGSKPPSYGRRYILITYYIRSTSIRQQTSATELYLADVSNRITRQQSGPLYPEFPKGFAPDFSLPSPPLLQCHICHIFTRRDQARFAFRIELVAGVGYC